MKTVAQVKKQLDLVIIRIKYIEKNTEAGTGAWSRTKGYADALEWVLDKK